MVYFTADQIRDMMNNPENIRNITLITQPGHGKGDFIQSLTHKSEIKIDSDPVYQRFGDSIIDEHLCGITIKRKGTHLFYNQPTQSTSINYLINLINHKQQSPYTPESSSTLRISDGALVLIDSTKGLCAQTETSIHQALQDRVKPVLIINKFDLNLFELQQDPESIYQDFCRIIEKVNSIIAIYDYAVMGDLLLDPIKGNVVFGSGLMGWAFDLKRFSKFYAEKCGIGQGEMIEKLWGEWYFDDEGKKWTREKISENGKSLKRGFEKFVVEPLRRLAQAVMQENNEEIDQMLKDFHIELGKEDRGLTKKRQLVRIMEKWLPADDCLLSMVVNHLPSPKQSQMYRIENLYEGPMDDECAIAMRNCDPNGPVMMYVSKMVPKRSKGRLTAFGRIFSGTIATGQKVRIMGPNFRTGKKNELFIKEVQRIALMTENLDFISNVPCGNVFGLMDFDLYLTNTGTISTHNDACLIKSMKLTTSPIVNVTIKPKNVADLPKMIEGMKKISRIDPNVKCLFEEAGGHIIAGYGEIHVKKCIDELIDYESIEIIQSDPFVNYKETVQSSSNQICMSKSPNKHNRLYTCAEPFTKGLCEAIETGTIDPMLESDRRTQILQEDFNWQPNDIRKIWAFGPKDNCTNVIVDASNGTQYLNEIKESIVAGFEWSTSEGCLCEENMRGVRFNIIDVSLHADAIHRGGGQIIPTIRRSLYAAFLTANPALLEPIYLVQIQCPGEVVGGVHQCLNRRRGIIFSEEQVSCARFTSIKAYLPVDESFGFEEDLKEKTSGRAFLTGTLLDHWSIISGDPTDPASLSYDIVQGIRERKGLAKKIIDLDMYLDKL